MDANAIINNATLLDTVLKAVSKLESFNFSINSNNINSCIFSTTIEGAGEIAVIAKYKYDIVINKKLNRLSTNEFLLSTIYHELCHIIQLNEAFLSNIIDFDPDTSEVLCISLNDNLLINTIFGDKYHSALWHDIAEDINKKIKLAIPIDDFISQDRLEQFLEEIIMGSKHYPKRFKCNIVDTTVNGIPLDVIDTYINEHQYIEPSYSINEDCEVKHSYRDKINADYLNDNN